MGLKLFHYLFIALAILLSLGFSGWCFHEDSLNRSSGYLWLGIASAVIGVALMAYGAWFAGKSRNLKD
jgi:hypothetical protein